MIAVLALITGFIVDLILGDPLWLPHPVRGIGSLVSKGEKVCRTFDCRTASGQLVCGIVLALVVCFLAFIIPFLILFMAYRYHVVLGFVLEVVMCYQILALKSLRRESMKVYYELVKGDLPEARKKLSFIVGRDTENLDQSRVIKATVETVAENLSDGVIAPLFFILLGGAPLGFLYKAINTLDSMIGYKNEKYFYFGRFAARLDDVANYLPARISAYLMIAAAYLSGLDGKGARRIYRRDRYKHPSPNSAHPEAACAGALQVQLAGDSYYSGRLVAKPTIGDDIRPVQPEDILKANRLLYVSSFLGLIIGAALKAIICLLY